MTSETRTHWDDVYAGTPDDRLSWHQDNPAPSLDLIARAGVGPGASVIDVGGGTSRLAGALLDTGLSDVTVLDLSQVALAQARARLGAAGETVIWVCADVTSWTPGRHYDLWHDRAVFHFLVDPADRAAYLERLGAALGVGGHAIIATFAPDGPEMCSGMPVVRYAPDDLAALLGEGFDLVAHRRDLHRTPKGRSQAFQFSLFRRVG